MNPDIQKIDRMLTSPIFRLVLPILILVLYVIGLFMMIFANFGQGLVFWFVSTVLGALLLYVKRTQEKKKADLLQVEADERAYQERLNQQNQEQN